MPRLKSEPNLTALTEMALPAAFHQGLQQRGHQNLITQGLGWDPGRETLLPKKSSPSLIASLVCSPMRTLIGSAGFSEL